MTSDSHRKLSRQEASGAVTGIGWRLVLGELRTQVLTGSLPLAADVAARAAAVPGAQGHLRMDVRADRVVFSLQTGGWVTARDAELAHRISAVAAHQRIEATVAAGGTVVYDAEAPAFWVLADPEGNEACITTWQGRDG